jgi:hypothetical protein
MKFEQIVEEIKRQRQYASDDLSDATPQTLTSRKSRKEIANLRLEDLYFNYRQEMRSRFLVVLVVGGKIDEFEAAVSGTDAKMDSLEGEALYSNLASKLDIRLLERGENAAYVLDVASRYLEEIASEIGVASYGQIIYKNKYQGRVDSKDKAKELIQQAVKEQVGSDMNSLFLLDTASRLAFSNDFGGKLFPVMIKVRSEENLKDLSSSLSSLGNKVIVLATDDSLDVPNSIKVEGLDEKSVLSALKKVKKASKSQ